MTDSLLIHPDGTTERIEDTNRHAIGEDRISAQLSVIVCGHPSFGSDDVHVMFIDDWGATKELPVNWKAWWLYGRSPVHGPVLLASDEGHPLSEEVLAAVEADGFPGEDAMTVMRQWLELNS